MQRLLDFTGDSRYEDAEAEAATTLKYACWQWRKKLRIGFHRHGGLNDRSPIEAEHEHLRQRWCPVTESALRGGPQVTLALHGLPHERGHTRVRTGRATQRERRRVSVRLWWDATHPKTEALCVITKVVLVYLLTFTARDKQRGPHEA